MTSDAKIKQSGFKIEKVDLAKPAVLEASAGTGKTYSLTGLVIRLLIGHKCLPLDLEHILLVTFTEAATADLRRKVLEKIISVREAFELSMLLESADLQSISSVDPFAQILLRELFDSKNGKFTEEIKSCLNDWINSLKIAERKIDKATISTIHSFCQNMLKRNAFESGVLFHRDAGFLRPPLQARVPLRLLARADEHRPRLLLGLCRQGLADELRQHYPEFLLFQGN